MAKLNDATSLSEINVGTLSGAVGFALAEIVRPLKAKLAEQAARIEALEGASAALLKRPILEYAGTFEPGKKYNRGQLLTSGGSLWHVDRDGMDTRPPGDGFTLVAKKGRDARDARR
jgi:hypothetical protein